MSVIIEKLRLDEKDIPQVYLTTTDFVLGDHSKGNYSYENHSYNVEIIRDLILNDLDKHDIYLGKHYGLRGISIEELLSNNFSEFIIEIPVGHIQYYDIEQLNLLSQRNKIIFADLEEGDNARFKWYDTQRTLHLDFFTDFLKNTYLNIDNVFFASSNFKKNRLCKEIHFLNIWVLMQSLSIPYVQEIIQDKSVYNHYLDLLTNKKYEKFALFRNWRVRTPRLILLSLLHKNHSLKDIDWTLIGDFGPRTYDIKEPGFFYNESIMEHISSGPFAECTDNFLLQHKKILPKFLYETDSTLSSANMHLESADFKKYRYTIDVESAMLISEKMVKGCLQGSMPIIVYPFLNGNFIQRITSIGFRIIDLGLDKVSNYNELLLHASNQIKLLNDNKIEPLLEDIVHNFNMCVDKYKLASYITQPLVDAFRPSDKYVRT